MADKKAKDDKKDDPKADDKKLVAKKSGADAGGEDDAEVTEGGEAGGKDKIGKKKIIIILGGVVLLLVAGSAGAYFTGALDKVLKHKPDCANVQEGDKDFAVCAEMNVKTAEAGSTTFIEIPDLIVNLNSATAKQPHFLKISLKVELEKKEDEKIFTDVLPRVIDQFQTYLRELRLEDLRGSSGLYRMKLELLTRVKAAAPGVTVRDVLFQEILVQ